MSFRLPITLNSKVCWVHQQITLHQHSNRCFVWAQNEQNRKIVVCRLRNDIHFEVSSQLHSHTNILILDSRFVLDAMKKKMQFHIRDFHKRSAVTNFFSLHFFSLSFQFIDSEISSECDWLVHRNSRRLKMNVCVCVCVLLGSCLQRCNSKQYYQLNCNQYGFHHIDLNPRSRIPQPNSWIKSWKIHSTKQTNSRDDLNEFELLNWQCQSSIAFILWHCIIASVATEWDKTDKTTTSIWLICSMCNVQCLICIRSVCGGKPFEIIFVFVW